MSNDLSVFIDQVKKKFNFKMWAVGLATAIILTPLIWLLASFLLGAAALGASFAIATFVGLVIVNVTPIVRMKLQNAKINAIIAEANKNPIPTLWAGFEADRKELDEMNAAIVEYATEIGNVQSKADKLVADLAPADIESFRKDIEAMELDLTLQERDYDEAMAAHGLHEVEIKRASAIWDLNMAVAKANSKNVNRSEETLAKIKRDTALDAVTASMNKSKAQLRSRIRNRSTVPGVAPAGLIENAASPVLEVQAATNFAKVSR